MSAAQSMTHVRKKETVAEYLDRMIDLCGKPQKEIAQELSYPKPNIITMFKQGKTKIPLTKVGPMARALGVDPVEFMQLVLNEYMPDTWEAIRDVFGMAVSPDEQKIVRAFRKTEVPVNQALIRDLETVFIRHARKS